MANPPDRRPVALYLLLAVAVVSAIGVHALLIPRNFPDNFTLALPAIVLGWGSFTLIFYAAGRLFSPKRDIPNMRGTDIGIGLFVFSLLISGILDSMGITVDAVFEAHILPAVGMYAGLALIGWALGQRTETINRIARPE